MMVEKMSTGRRPNDVWMGTLNMMQTISRLYDTLQLSNHSSTGRDDVVTHQRKLLKPSTRIQTPTNCTTPARSVSNVSISCGNIGGSASGPKPCAKLTSVTIVMADAFQNGLQFCRPSASEHATSHSRCAWTYQWIIRVSTRLRHQDLVGFI